MKTKPKTGEFTELELKVLRALHESMRGNGFDFGFVDEATKVKGMDRKSAGAVLRGLRKKISIRTWDAVTTDSGTFEQITAEWKGEESPDFGADFDTFLAAIVRVRRGAIMRDTRYFQQTDAERARRQASARKPKRGYRAGVELIALNDEPLEMDVEQMSGFATVMLLAHLFRKTQQQVAADVVKFRQGQARD